MLIIIAAIERDILIPHSTYIAVFIRLTLSKRKKKSGSKDEHRAIVLNLLAALINLVVAILYFIDKLTE